MHVVLRVPTQDAEPPESVQVYCEVPAMLFAAQAALTVQLSPTAPAGHDTVASALHVTAVWGWESRFGELVEGSGGGRQ